MGDKSYKWRTKFTIALCLISLTVLNTTQSFAQAREVESAKPKSSKSAGFDPSKLVIGGSLGGSFGDITYFEIAPRVGYFFKENWLSGVAFKYAYYEERTPFVNFESRMYGGGFFTQYFFLRYFVAHAEYEALNVDDFRIDDQRTTIHSLFVGGGISSRIGTSNSFFNLLLLYNLNETYNSPYANPYLQIGVGVGL